MATIKEVSRLAGVSTATVSRVLNGTVPVADATRARVLAAVDELDYRPNAFARSLVTNRSGGIGVIVKALSSTFFAPMLRGIETAVRQRGMHLMVSSGHVAAEEERRTLDFLLQRRPDALILNVEGLPDDALRELAAGPVPLVVLGRRVSGLEHLCVYLDNELGGALMTRHLLEHGHRRIAHIMGSQTLEDGRARLAGYRRTLAEAGLPFDDTLVVEGDFDEEGGYRATRALLDRHPDFTAVFAGNDQMAAGCLVALREAGIEVPRDVSLVGHDDVRLARYLFPALTTARQPVQEMGSSAARIALAALDGVEEEVKKRFVPDLVVRSSVRAEPTHEASLGSTDPVPTQARRKGSPEA